MKRKTAYFILSILLLILILAPAAQAQEKTDIIRAYLFYSPTCESCTQVRREVIPFLYQEYEQRLQILAIDISNKANYDWWLAIEEQYGVDSDTADVPELFMGKDVLVGVEQIQQELPSLIQKYAEAGGIDYPNVPRPQDAPEPTATFMFFHSPTCGHCQYIKDEIFPMIKTKYGDRVTWESFSTQEEQNYKALLLLEELAGIPAEGRGGVPVVFIGDEYGLYSLLVGSNDIPTYLPTTIDWFMNIGGVGLPEWKDELFDVVLTPPAETPTTTVDPTADQPTPTPNDAVIHLAYFAEVGCSECDRVSIALEHVQNEFPNLVVHEFDIIDDLSINLCLGERLGVPENEQHDAPAIFVGTDFLVDRDIYYESLVEVVSKYVASGAEPAWELCDNNEIVLPPPPPWWAVIIPGLIDGINPCAFATIVFFVSYLSLIERKGHEVVLVGIAFVLAVFLSYLAFGMILRQVFAGLVDILGPVLRPILNTLMAVLCLILALLSLADFRKAHHGRTQDMTLRLPDRLRRWINKTIRQSMKAETFVAGAFVAGVVVSFIELACTGQVYVPIIQGLSNPDYRLQSTIGLIVYCIAFVLPLIAVFIVSYMGTSSRQLGTLLQKYTASVKLITAILFLGIGVWLIYDVLRIWGLIAPLKV
ncbi:MAG: hypothetical protein JXA89_16065 [Anaerolineae bacterium]|nr:hypothetical protein [Anaerolineae bacterium]